MNAHEIEVARKIVSVLDVGARKVSGEALAQLSAAREQALAGYRESPAMKLAWAGQSAFRSERPAAGLRYALPIALLIIALAGLAYWQTGTGQNNELADLDARLLTDDLPIDAYLDKGFDSWLKRQSR